MTIKEMTSRYEAELPKDGVGLGTCLLLAYRDGLNDMKAEMIDKACEWFANYLFEIGYPDDWVRDNGTWMNGAAGFRKAMEEDI